MIKVGACGVFKDEIDVLPYTIEHWLEQDIDKLLLADNMSTDGTRDVIHDFARKYPKLIVPLDDTEKAWYQSVKVTELARLTHEYGCDWIIPIDADEWWTTDNGFTVGSIIRSSPFDVIGAPILNYIASHGDDASESNPYYRMTWRNPPSNLVKVAYKWKPNLVVMTGNHGLTLGAERLYDHPWHIEMRHCPYRSAEQFAKGIINGGSALRATNLPETYGGHWRDYYRHYEATGEEGLKDWWRLHFYLADPASKGLVQDPIVKRVMA